MDLSVYDETNKSILYNDIDLLWERKSYCKGDLNE